VNSAADFFGQAIFHTAPQFPQDTAGYAVIHSGQDHVQITYSQQYDTPPIVTISLQEKALSLGYAVVNNTATGFTIQLSQAPLEDIHFSWIAVAVENPKTFEGQSGGSTIVPAASASSLFIPASSATLSANVH